MDVYIFGAKATAVGAYKALSVLEPEKKVKAFLVSDRTGNPKDIWGCPVRLLKEVSEELSEEEKSAAKLYVAVPGLIHKEIKELLESYGFKDLVMVDPRMEANLMERYFQKEGGFRSIHSLRVLDHSAGPPRLTIYAASFYKDQTLDDPPRFPPYVKKLYLGCDGAVRSGVDISGCADFYDHTGDHISSKNPNRCEMTAHYWVWKNRLDTDDGYVGIYHYRRALDLTDVDLIKMQQNDVDIVLPFPMIHYPDSRIHHTWYVPEQDWELMIEVLRRSYPEYAANFDKIFDRPCFYNYNMMVAKKKVFADYCAWLYPILDQIEELSEPKGMDRRDRYTAYMSESLTTLYFMMHKEDLKICHTGRLLFT